MNVKLDRTVRMGLWGGEEEGLLGSRAYVKEHFADPETMKPTAEHAKITGYFNVDNGTGKLRGVYLQGNDMVRPIFQAWMEPSAISASRRSPSATPAAPITCRYDAVGLPGFQFIQDPRGVYEPHPPLQHGCLRSRQKSDLMQAAAIVAAFVYNTAIATRCFRASRCRNRNRVGARERAAHAGSTHQLGDPVSRGSQFGPSDSLVLPGWS